MLVSGARGVNAFQIFPRGFASSHGRLFVRRTLCIHHVPHSAALSANNAVAPIPSKTRPPSGVRRERVKRKVALYVGYDGAPYHGMQRNAGVQAVSDVLEQALHEAGAISDENFGFLEKIKWTVAARTDRGVSAAGNVVSLKVMWPRDAQDDDVELKALTDRVNKGLPEHVKVFGADRVTSSFSARLSCAHRAYEYLLPSSTVLEGGNLDNFGSILGRFEGTHPFHNYTVGVDHVMPPRPQANRLVLNFTCDEKPFVMQASDMCGSGVNSEWIRIRIRGQSFMLHQIRKMISMALLVHRGHLPDDAVEKSLSRGYLINIPPAPAVGLFLDYCSFEWYNERHHERLPRPVCLRAHDKQRETFKQDYVLPSIARRANQEDMMAIFFQTVERHAPTFPHMCRSHVVST